VVGATYAKAVTERAAAASHGVVVTVVVWCTRVVLRGAVGVSTSEGAARPGTAPASASGASGASSYRPPTPTGRGGAPPGQASAKTSGTPWASVPPTVTCNASLHLLAVCLVVPTLR
jgi:hypothetical protein